MRAGIDSRIQPAAGTGGLAAWVQLVKPRLSALVVFAAFTGGLLADGPGADLLEVVEAAFFIGLTAAASGVFNQVLERDADRLMERTRRRPLATGRLGVRDAVLFGAALACAGATGLALEFNALSALLALATLSAYVLVYTPLKRVSSFNTTIGAIPGAMPPLVGYVAIAGEPGPWAWFLFAVVFVWQFPHFLAIAWIHRDDYRRAGMKMLPALPASGGLAGRQAFLYGLVLLPVSLLPTVQGAAGATYTLGALVLGLGFIATTAAFAQRETLTRARAVLIGSIAYLPLLFSLVLFDPVVHRALIR